MSVGVLVMVMVVVMMMTMQMDKMCNREISAIYTQATMGSQVNLKCFNFALEKKMKLRTRILLRRLQRRMCR